MSDFTPAQVDYRQNPSAGNVDFSNRHYQVYGQDLDGGAATVAPYPDLSIRSYDLPSDAGSTTLRDPAGEATT